MNSLNIYYIDLNHKELIQVCKDSDSIQILQPNICTIILFSLGGFDLQNFNISMLPTFFGHLPDGFSIKEFSHFGQAVLSGKYKYIISGKPLQMINMTM